MTRSTRRNPVPPLIYTKVRIPPVRNLWSRPRLLDFMHENIHRKLILVSAGPGYGKTSALVDFCQHTDLAVCWYTLEANDRDPRLFLDYLVESLRVRFPGFGEQTRALLRQGQPGGLQSVVGVLINELVEEIPEYVVLILDEYQVIEDEASINQVLQVLLQYLPEHVHLVIAGRSAPSLPMIRLAAYGQVAGLDADALRFTVEETQGLFRQNFNLYLSEEELGQLIRESEGWITGILLGAQAIWQGMSHFLAGTRGPYDRVYAYLTTEVLRYLAPDVQDFLRKAAILSQMDPQFCDALLGRNDSAAVLELLERRNLFVIPLPGGWYRFHGLFRDLLRREAQADEAEFIRLNRRAAEIWQQRGEPGEAIEHLLQAGAVEEAAEKIEAMAQKLFLEWRLATLARWTAALPETIQQKHPRLLRFCGKAYIISSQIDQAFAFLERAQQILAERDDLEEYVQALADQSTLAQLRGNYQQSWALAQQGIEKASGRNMLALADLHRVLGWCQMHWENLRQAEVHLCTAVDLSLANDLLYNQAIAWQDLGFCLNAQGRTTEAESVYRKSLACWQQVGNPGPIAVILNNLAMGPFLRGELDEAEKLLQQALAPARTSLSSYVQSLVLASLGDLYRDRQRFQAAAETYRQGLDVAPQNQRPEMAVYLLVAQGDLARQEGDLLEAAHFLARAEEKVGESQRGRAWVQLARAMLATAQGEAHNALTILDELAPTLDRAGERVQLLRARLAQAVAWYWLGQLGPARASFQQAIILARDTGVVEPFLAEVRALRPLLSHLDREKQDPFLQQIVRLISPVTESKEQAEPAPLAPIRILALNSGAVLVNGAEVSLKDWGSRLARELFFYLFFCAPVTKEQAGTIFWPEQDAAHMTSSFHATLYRARRAIGTPFVVFEDELYWWNSDLPWRSDVDEFERLLAQARQATAKGSSAIGLLEQAVALYQGDFLDGLSGDWLLVQREALREAFLRTLLELGDLYCQQTDWLRAQETYRRVLQVDDLSEPGYRGLMYAYARGDNRAEAILAYRRCSYHLRQELQVRPSEETRKLYRAISQGQFDQLHS